MRAIQIRTGSYIYIYTCIYIYIIWYMNCLSAPVLQNSTHLRQKYHLILFLVFPISTLVGSPCLDPWKGEKCPDALAIESCIDGNLCRCTGSGLSFQRITYRPGAGVSGGKYTGKCAKITPLWYRSQHMLIGVRGNIRENRPPKKIPYMGAGAL